MAWNQERPDELWIGHRNTPNEYYIKDPSLLKEAARPYADLPGGHSEGYDDTFKQVFTLVPVHRRTGRRAPMPQLRERRRTAPVAEFWKPS